MSPRGAKQTQGLGGNWATRRLGGGGAHNLLKVTRTRLKGMFCQKPRDPSPDFMTDFINGLKAIDEIQIFIL
jgi:hypothetical protein